MKKILFCILIVPLIFTGCLVPGTRSDQGVYYNLTKFNDDLNKKVKELQNEIKSLKSSKEIDFSKAELLKKVELIEKKYKDALSASNKRDKNLQHMLSGNERLQQEFINTKNEVMMLQKNNADLNALVAKLSSYKLKTVSQDSLTVSKTNPNQKTKIASAQPLKIKKIPQKKKAQEDSSTVNQVKKTNPAKEAKIEKKKQRVANKKDTTEVKKSIKTVTSEAKKVEPDPKSKPQEVQKPKIVKKEPIPPPESKTTVASKKQTPKPVVAANKTKQIKLDKAAAKTLIKSTTSTAKKQDVVKAKKLEKSLKEEVKKAVSGSKPKPEEAKQPKMVKKEKPKLSVVKTVALGKKEPSKLVAVTNKAKQMKSDKATTKTLKKSTTSIPKKQDVLKAKKLGKSLKGEVKKAVSGSKPKPEEAKQTKMVEKEKAYYVKVAATILPESADVIQKDILIKGFQSTRGKNKVLFKNFFVVIDSAENQKTVKSIMEEINLSNASWKVQKTENNGFQILSPPISFVKEAEKLKKQIGKKNLKVKIIQKKVPTLFHEVRVGKFKKRENAIPILKKLQVAGIKGIIVER